jgi:regulatory protein
VTRTTGATFVVRIRPSGRQPSARLVEVPGIGRYRLDAATVSALGLEDDAEVDAATAAQVRAAASRLDARAIALRLLQRRLRSRAELEGALRRRGIPREVVYSVMADLARVGWIDDARFARAWIRDRLALRPGGRRRFRAELAVRGVAADVIDAALQALLSPADEEAAALEQARARLRRLRGLPPPVVRRRLAGWLQRRGYGQPAIARALRLVGAPDADAARDAELV